jgi:hypothetical protein
MYFIAFVPYFRSSMEYAPFLRGDEDDIPWDDVVPPTEDDFIGTQLPTSEEQNELPAACGRGSSYTIQEDLLLVKSWLNVSMDPVVGTNQSMGAFWQRIETFYHEHKEFPTTRNKKSLQGRWTFVNGMVQRFCGHYAKALRTRRSGMTEADTVSIIKC